jgi:DNA-binding beta-propeller fold protein YncE
MFGDTTRGLARSPDGSRVYAAVFNSGNKTTTILPHHPSPPLEKPSPIESHDGEEAPLTGMIVQYNGQNWVDNGDPVNGVAPREWSDYVRFTLPDNDLFTIDAMAKPPVVIKAYKGVGTTLFNIAVNPVSQKL